MRKLAPLLTVVLACCTDPDPQPPTACGTVESQEVHTGNVVTVSPCFEDPEGGILTLTANSSAGLVLETFVTHMEVHLRGVSPGTAMVTVTATDPDSLTATLEFKTEVPNRAPTVSSEIPDTEVYVGDATEWLLSMHFSDPDGQQLKYSASSSDSITATVSVNESTLTAIGEGAGLAVITAVATDPGGLTAEQDFDFNVKARDTTPVILIFRDEFDADSGKWMPDDDTTIKFEKGHLQLTNKRRSFNNWVQRALEDTIPAHVRVTTEARYEENTGVDVVFFTTGSTGSLLFSVGKNIMRRDDLEAKVDYVVHWVESNRYQTHEDLYGKSSLVPEAGKDFEFDILMDGTEITVWVDGGELLSFDLADYTDLTIEKIAAIVLGVFPREREFNKSVWFDWFEIGKLKNES